jgi:hypothetical protein
MYSELTTKALSQILREEDKNFLVYQRSLMVQGKGFEPLHVFIGTYDKKRKLS